jgi:hypothetical protein
MSYQGAAQRAQPIEGARFHGAGRDLQYACRFGHRPVVVIDFGQYLALQTGQGGDCGADANLVDAGVGLLAAGERKVVVQFGLWGAGLPGTVGVDGQVPSHRDQPASR